MKTFKNETVLITGASSGIGKALAVTFAEQGSQVVLTDLSLDVLQATEQECSAIN